MLQTQSGQLNSRQAHPTEPGMSGVQGTDLPVGRRDFWWGGCPLGGVCRNASDWERRQLVSGEWGGGCPHRPALPHLSPCPSLSTDLGWEGPDGAHITLGTVWVSGREEFQKLNTQRAAGHPLRRHLGRSSGGRAEPPDPWCVCWRLLGPVPVVGH